MSGTTSKSQVFVTKENSIRFVIHPALEGTLSDENLNEIFGNIAKLPKDYIVIDGGGVEIRHSLVDDQKQEIIDMLARITKNDVEYLENAEVIDFSGHVELEYLLQNPEILKKRGWSEDEIEFIKQVHSTLANAQVVDKAHLTFDKTGVSADHLTWTIIGDDNGIQRKLIIKFQAITLAHEAGAPEEIVVVITVKKMN